MKRPPVICIFGCESRPKLDKYGYEVRRFYPAVSQNTSWNNQRSHKSYVYDKPKVGKYF